MKHLFSNFMKVFLSFAMICSSFTMISAAEVKETSTNTNAYEIYPIPQSITYHDGGFSLESAIIIVDDGIDQYTKDYLEEILDEYGINYEYSDRKELDKTNIALSINGGSDSVADIIANSVGVNDTDLYDRYDAYMLDVSDQQIVIQGKDCDSVFYGLATLKMMLSSFDTWLYYAHIEDYATIDTRGFIEGFYGAWKHQERLDLMEFARDYKMNSYVYAAKQDSYHTSNWAVLYPQEQLNEFKELVEMGKKTKVEFGWSIHMGSFFNGLSLSNTTLYEERYNKLIAKFNQLYEIGVRKFDILNDDFGSGSHSDVVTVLNRINQEFIIPKGCATLSYCPQGYNTSWSGNGAELEALKNLDEGILLYWTGADVNTPITQDTVDYVTSKSNHKPNYWLNYPVNEHAGSGIFLGDITYYAQDNITGIEAFHSNPCRYPYASEVALYQLAAWTWNNNNYDENATKVWESAFNYLQPEVKDEYFKIATHIANAPNSSRVPGYNESENIKDALANLINTMNNGEVISDNEDFVAAINEFKAIKIAIDDFRTYCTNHSLVNELDPWLKSLKDLAVAGEAILECLYDISEEDYSSAWDGLSKASNAYATCYTYNNAADKAAKAGSKYIEPFVSKAIAYASDLLEPIVNPSDEIKLEVIARVGGVDKTQDANMALMIDGNESTYGGWQVKQVANDYFGLDLGIVTKVTDFTIVQGQNDTHHDVFHNAKVQYSIDKKEWFDLDATVNGNTVTVQDLDIKARYLRYFLVETGYNGKPDYWTFVREMYVNQNLKTGDKVYTNVEAYKETPITIEGSSISIRDLNNITLKPQEYIGLTLQEAKVVKAFLMDTTTTLDIEHSLNEMSWTKVSELDDLFGVKYLRIKNTTNNDVTFNISKLGIDIQNLDANASFVSNSVTGGISSGDYANLFDGDYATSITTASNLSKDDTIVFDLGASVEVHDVTLVMSDGLNRLYDAKVQVSTDAKNWSDAVVIADDNTEFVVPYRYAKGNANGINARYLRILVDKDSSNSLILNEIEINKNVERVNVASVLSASFDGNLSLVDDNDITTALTKSVKPNDYIEYEVLGNVTLDKVSVLQGSATNAKVYLVSNGVETLLGSLDSEVSVLDVTSDTSVDKVKVVFEQVQDIEIFEFNVIVDESLSDDIGVVVDPIIVDEVFVPVTRNIAVGKEVVVSGTSDGDKNNVNDEDLNTKWDSQAIKNGTQDTGDAWIYIDLGDEQVYEMSQIVVSFFNKIYPTSWVVEVSDDATNWEAVSEVMTSANNGPTNPVETINFDQPIIRRYVRLYFNTINTAAAGNGIGVKEFEIYGKEFIEEQPPVDDIDRTALEKALSDAAKIDATLYTEESVAALEEAVASAKIVNENANATQSEIDAATKLVTDALAALATKPSVNKDALTKAINDAKAIDKTKYTDESFGKLTDAIFAAEAVLNSTSAPQATVDAATKAITDAIANLKEKPTTPVVDKEVLKVAIETAEKVDTSKYTSDSVAALASALAAAKEIYAKEDATQDEVDAAKTALGQALAKLKDKPIEPTPDPKPAMNFVDVKEGAWFYGSVESAYQKGLMSNTGKGKEYFEPDTPISRGMVATVLYRMAGLPKVEFKATFSDVTNSKLWYATAITWASQNGVVSGYKDGRFGPDDNITRQDLAIMLRNFAKANGLDTNAKVDFSAFKDGNKVVSYAQSAVQFCIDAKLMSGAKKADGVYLNPTDNATRAECAKMFSLLDDAIKAK